MHRAKGLSVLSLMTAGLLAFGGSVFAAVHHQQVAVSPPPAIDYRFGVAEANANPALAAETGLGWTRVAFFWNYIEPSPHVYDLSSVANDQSLLQLASAGIAVVGVVEGEPPWAASRTPPRPGVAVAPKGLYLAWNNPANTWGQFMYWLARHYAGLINTWIIGNEISIRSGPNQTWSGTVDQFARMIMVADEAVQAANPEGRVLLPAAPYWYTHGHTTSALLSALASLPGAAAHHDFVSGLPLNLYSPVPYNPVIYNTYETILKDHGLSGLPIWLTEANITPITIGNPNGATSVQQASFIVEDLATSFAWVSQAEIYKLQDRFLTDATPYGLVAANGGNRLALNAFEEFVRIMRGATWLSQSIWAEDGKDPAPSTPAIVTWGAPGRLIQVVWDQGPEPTTVTLPAVATSATVINLAGQSQTITPSDGNYTISLQPATIGPTQSPLAPIGGPPVYVIQQVPLGQDGTPVAWVGDTTTGFPVAPEGAWDESAPVVVPPGAVSVTVNPSGDQVVINDQGQLHWIDNAGSGPDALNTPIAAVVGLHDWIYVDNFGNSDVLVYRRNGTLLTSFGGYGTAPGQLLGPSGIAVGPSGTVYVTNAGAETVVAYSPTGQFLWQVGGYGTGPGRFNGPDGITVGSNGTIYVADTLNNRIVELSPSGQYEGSLGTPFPTQLAWNAAGHLRVLNGLTGTWSTTSLTEPLTTSAVK